MTEPTERDTPPKQTPNDPNLADRRLTEEQHRAMKNEPASPDKSKSGNLPDPKDVGEAG